MQHPAWQDLGNASGYNQCPGKRSAFVAVLVRHTLREVRQFVSDD
ncbi:MULTISPECIES: hypothetical protein [Candidatus Accumulibacter]|uniref:Uncharacterized protein n=1 Tax=Candidatus Accumulibacter phosphatis TaxID=327160 RepID=A0A5S4EHC3_9PROT|nr:MULTISPECIES: hypothetical protein [Candidatus Accumulibacter]TMQ74697.1 hypothetical protein ACCUM_3571 [Candidatus Accumulibacter phosphatis]HMW57467.1 hypothetical protein [Accumulibacter sp.]HNC22410.1 hypothetical protein [Accumulibacter sp.]